MVRLMLTLTPVVCILSGIAFSGLLELFLREDDTPRPGDSDAEEDQAVGGGRRLYDKVHRSPHSLYSLRTLIFSRLVEYQK